MANRAAARVQLIVGHVSPTISSLGSHVRSSPCLSPSASDDDEKFEEQFKAILKQVDAHVKNRKERDKKELMSMFGGDAEKLAKFILAHTFPNFLYKDLGQEAAEYRAKHKGGVIYWRGKIVDGKWRLGTAGKASSPSGREKEAWSAGEWSRRHGSSGRNSSSAGKTKPWSSIVNFAVAGGAGGLAGASLYECLHKRVLKYFSDEITPEEVKGLQLGRVLSIALGAKGGSLVGTSLLAAAVTGVVVGFVTSGVVGLVSHAIGHAKLSAELLERTRMQLAELCSLVSNKMDTLTQRADKMEKEVQGLAAFLSSADEQLAEYGSDMPAPWQIIIDINLILETLPRILGGLNELMDELISTRNNLKISSEDLAEQARRAYEEYRKARTKEEAAKVIGIAGAGTCGGSAAGMVAYSATATVLGPIGWLLFAGFMGGAATGLGGAVAADSLSITANNHERREEELRSNSEWAVKQAQQADQLHQRALQLREECSRLMKEAHRLNQKV